MLRIYKDYLKFKSKNRRTVLVWGQSFFKFYKGRLQNIQLKYKTTTKSSLSKHLLRYRISSKNFFKSTTHCQCQCNRLASSKSLSKIQRINIKLDGTSAFSINSFPIIIDLTLKYLCFNKKWKDKKKLFLGFVSCMMSSRITSWMSGLLGLGFDLNILWNKD